MSLCTLQLLRVVCTSQPCEPAQGTSAVVRSCRGWAAAELPSFACLRLRKVACELP
jgi:hypothetical protein